MQQRAQDIIVLTRSAWQAPTPRELSGWAARRDPSQSGPAEPRQPTLPRPSGSTTQVLHA